jgi:hypothetical protein
MNFTAHDIEQAWNVSGVTLTNNRISAVTGGDADRLNERLARAIAAETLNVPAVPAITRRQLRLWLHRNGKLDAVISALSSLPEPAKTEAAIEWEDATGFERNHPMVEQIGTALGLNALEMDNAWLEAAGI